MDLDEIVDERRLSMAWDRASLSPKRYVIIYKFLEIRCDCDWIELIKSLVCFKFRTFYFNQLETWSNMRLDEIFGEVYG